MSGSKLPDKRTLFSIKALLEKEADSVEQKYRNSVSHVGWRGANYCFPKTGQPIASGVPPSSASDYRLKHATWPDDVTNRRFPPPWIIEEQAA